MPFDYLEQDQDEAAVPAGSTEFSRGIPVLRDPGLGKNLSHGILPVDVPVKPATGGPPGVPSASWQTRTAEIQPQSQSPLGIGHRIVGMGQPQESLQPGPSWAANPQPMESGTTLGIGHRILGITGGQAGRPETGLPNPLANTTPEAWKNRLVTLPYQTGSGLKSASNQPNSGFLPSQNGQQSQGFFSSFVPAGADSNGVAWKSEPGRTADPGPLERFSRQSPTSATSTDGRNVSHQSTFADQDFRGFLRSETNPIPDPSLGSIPPRQIGITADDLDGTEIAAGATGVPAAAKHAPKTQQSPRKEGLPIPPLGGSVGRGAKNDAADVQRVQQLLNAAVDNEDISGPKIPEDGKVTERMLQMIDQYQQVKKIGKQSVIDQKSPVIRALASNPLWDPRWSEYDGIIKKEVDSYNKLFQQKYPQGFQPLDWRRVKAMLWTEVHGPDAGNGLDWRIWPMQIGKKKADPGMAVIRSGAENTYRYVPLEVRYKLRHQKMSGELNIRAGIAYLYDRAMDWKGDSVIDDPTERTYRVKPGDTLEGLAKRLHTTVGELMQQNGLDEKTAESLRAGRPLKYRYAHEIPRWLDWPTASFLYNSTGDPGYAEKVERKYTKIKRRW